MPKISGIYEIRNTENNKVYIGCSSNIKQRWYQHRTDLRRGIHSNSYLQHAFLKYGENKFVFSIVEMTIIDLVEREQHWLDSYKSYERPNGYNLAQRASRRTQHIICTIDGCVNKHLCHGLCNKHYRRLKRHGSIHLREGHIERILGRGCVVIGCNQKHDSHGYCANHAYYIREYGEIRKPKTKHIGCCVEGCPNKHASNGFCHGHQERHRYRMKMGILEDFKLSRKPNP